MTEQNQQTQPNGPVSCVRIASHDRVSSLLADTPSKPHQMSAEVQRKLAARAVGMAMVARRLARELEPCGS